MEANGANRESIRRIVDRLDLDEVTDGVVNSFWDRPEYRLHRPARGDVRDWVRWNIQLVVRWLVTGTPPSKAELERFRERARELAVAGMPEHVVPANFRRGARFAWSALLDAATDEERPALLGSADLMFDYVDRVSQLFADSYGAGDPDVATPLDERRARALLRRLSEGADLVAEDHRLAEAIGFEVASAYRPFVLVAPHLPAQRHDALAAELRRRGALATSEGARVIGIATRAVAWGELGVGGRMLHADGALVPGEQVADALDELRTIVDLAARRGRSGAVRVDDYLPELLLRRSPRLAARARQRLYGALDPELARTLDLLVEHDFDRAATAAALPVHRNTLTNRLRRIRDTTGVDIERSDGRTLAWLAWLERAGV